MDMTVVIRVIAGALAIIILGVIIWRRRRASSAE
jgi:hypothetical protein